MRGALIYDTTPRTTLTPPEPTLRRSSLAEPVANSGPARQFPNCETCAELARCRRAVIRLELFARPECNASACAGQGGPRYDSIASRVLIALRATATPSTAFRLAAALGLRRENVSAALKHLAKAGAAERCGYLTADKRRMTLWRPGPAGRQRVSEGESQ